MGNQDQILLVKPLLHLLLPPSCSKTMMQIIQLLFWTMLSVYTILLINTEENTLMLLVMPLDFITHGMATMMNLFGVQLGWQKQEKLHIFPRLNLTIVNSV